MKKEILEIVKATFKVKMMRAAIYLIVFILLFDGLRLFLKQDTAASLMVVFFAISIYPVIVWIKEGVMMEESVIMLNCRSIGRPKVKDVALTALIWLAVLSIGLYLSTYWLTSAVFLAVIVVSAVLFGRLLLSTKRLVTASAKGAT